MGREKRIMSQDNEYTGNFLKNRGERRPLGSPVGKTLHFHCRGCRFDPGPQELRSHFLGSTAKKKFQKIEEREERGFGGPCFLEIFHSL